MNMLYRYITPYTTYLPFDIKTYFYSKLRMDDPDKQKEFNKNYEAYEKRIFANFVHEHQFYYLENNSANIYALFPPVELLNNIADELEQK